MYNIIGSNQYYNKIFDESKYHNQNLSDLFLSKEHQLKPVSVDYNRIKGLQTYNDLYNIFEWDNKSIKWLGNNIYNFITEIFDINDIDNYFIHCWFNVLNTDETLPWHTHFKRFEECKNNTNLFMISGHYMVDAEDSFTIYEDKEEFSIPTKNGLCTIFDPMLKHKTDFKEDGLRISVAFDVIPDRKCTRGRVLYKLRDIK